ncbi:hypothetical protein [Bacillus vallismortis]|nr:hypothetical protein [Bacillus vallismortis]
MKEKNKGSWCAAWEAVKLLSQTEKRSLLSFLFAYFLLSYS